MLKRDANDILREDGEDALRAAFDAAAAHPYKPKLIGFSAADLRHMQFPPIKYVVPGYIVEGLSLLAGRPKKGKSWLLLHAAIAVARGGVTLGDVQCVQGDVFYAALEDNKRRLQSRMTKLLQLQS